MAKYRTQADLYDPVRGGLGVLLMDPSGSTVAEVFRSDHDHVVSLERRKKDIPEWYMEHLLARARLLLDPFDDGTPLVDAVRCPPRLRKMLEERSK